MINKIIVQCAYGQKIELLTQDEEETNKIINTIGQSKIDGRFFHHRQGTMSFLINPEAIVSVVAYPMKVEDAPA